MGKGDVNIDCLYDPNDKIGYLSFNDQEAKPIGVSIPMEPSDERANKIIHGQCTISTTDIRSLYTMKKQIDKLIELME